MPRYIFEAELTPDGESSAWNVSVPDLEGCFTFGDDINDAVEQAADALITYIAALLKYDDPIPEPVFGHTAPENGKIVALAVEASADYIIDTVSPSRAAELLGVSRSRVSQMIRDNVLVSISVAGERRIDLKSVHDRLNSPRSAGRPSKTLGD